MLFSQEWKAIVQRPLPFLFCIVFPILLMGLFILLGYGMLNPSSDEKITAAIIDEDGTFETKALLSQLQSETKLQEVVELKNMTFQEAKKSLEEGNITGYILIPKGFTESLRIGENDPLYLVTSNQQMYQGSLLDSFLNSGASYISAAQSGVNTVYDLYLKGISDSKERNELLNQTIVSYSMFALGRNQWFQNIEVPHGASNGWSTHIIVAYLFTTLMMSMLLYLFLWESPTKNKFFLERLRMLNKTRPHLILHEFGRLWIFGVFVLFVNYGITILTPFTMHMPLLKVTGLILITSFVFSTFILFFYHIFHSPGLGFAGSGFIMSVIFYLEGIWIPSIYLPESPMWTQWVYPFPNVYSIWVEGVSTKWTGEMIQLVIMGIVYLILLVLFAIRKEKHYAYYTISPS
ncbi:ABC transporter permease [Bacillaceae bacterium S4-13-58]